MIQVGIDIVEIGRIRKAILRWGERFLSRIYTPTELSMGGKIASLAANFAAKEATMKALGKRLPWQEIEVLRDSSGKPQIKLKGNTCKLEVSLSHSKEYAIAVVIKSDENTNS